MAVTREQAREIAHRFLSVFGFSPDEDEEDAVIEWDVILNSNLLTTGESPKNFARRLLIMTARNFLEDENIIIFPSNWNNHIDELEEGRETVGNFIDFLVTEI